MNSPPLIHVENVHFGYDHEPVLDAINLDVQRREFLGIIGPNGGGKTTLLRIMLGLLKPKTGNVYLFGEPISQFRQWSRIGYVPQRAAQLETNFPITVAEVVSLGRVRKIGWLRRFTGKDRQAVLDALAEVGMQDFHARRITDLSGGQQQRVFIARALVSEPDILFLDEPTTGVDIEAQEQFYQLLADLNTRLGLTLVMVSHDIETVINEVTRVACLNRRLVYHGDPGTLSSDDILERLYGQSRKLVLHSH